MHCLDTDVIIWYFKGDQLIKSKIDAIEKSELFTTTITLCELYRGAFLSQNSEKNLIIVNKLLESINIMGLDAYSCQLYGKIYAELKKSGNLTQDCDLMIAALCIANDKILATRNRKHFDKIKGLKIESW